MSGEGPRKKCSRDGEYGDDERICRRANVDETWIDVLSESTRQQRLARFLGDSTETTEADANGHEVSADNVNSNANNAIF